MRSSTSSSSVSTAKAEAANGSTVTDGVFARSLPRVAWSRNALIAVLIAVVATALWEAHVRGMGYRPCLNDSSDLWARARSRVSDDPEQMVVVGSSRILFDLDLQTCADSLGVATPVQLAMPGTNPLPILEDLADDQQFRGILVLGLVPGLWMAPDGSMPAERARQAVGRYHNWSPSQKVGLGVGLVLQKKLAFINAEDLTLPDVLKKYLLIEDRAEAEANLPPTLPPYFAWPDEHRQNRMWEKCDFGTPLAARIQQIWIPLFTPPAPPPGVTEDEFRQMMQKGAEHQFDRIAAAARKLHARGARIVWVRPPSTGEVREIERRTTPREAIYAPMVAASESPGIHYADYPDLAGFDCPEWSHLTAEDAVLFSRALMPHLRAVLATLPAAPQS